MGESTDGPTSPPPLGGKFLYFDILNCKIVNPNLRTSGSDTELCSSILQDALAESMFYCYECELLSEPEMESAEP